MQLLSITLAGLLSGSALAIAVRSPACIPGTAQCASDAVGKRTTAPTQVCNADNVLRALRDARYSVSASAFCSTYIQSTAVVTNTATVTGTTTIATVTPVTTQTIDTTVTETDTLTSTSTPYVFQTTTSAPIILQRQGAASPLPSYVSGYPASRVSSACSCFVTPSAAKTSTVQVTISTNIPATETLPTTTTSVTSFSTAISLATTTVVGPAVSCPSIIGCILYNTYLSSSSVPSVAACEALCLSNSACESFQTGPDNYGGINCNLDNVPKDQAHDPTVSDYCNQYTIFNIGCD